MQGDGPAIPGPQILIVEDDAHLSRALSLSLEAEGYRVVTAETSQRALEEVKTRSPEVILLDLGLPDGDGLALIPLLRANTNSPILVVTARMEEGQKVSALDGGANDYLTKPVAAAEFRARIRAALRTQARGSLPAPIVLFGVYKLDLQARRFWRGAREISLSATEYKLLAALARHANEVVTTATLLKETWGTAYQLHSDYLRVYMHSLRQKIEKDPARPRHLINHVGLGYSLRTLEQ
ncbi:MAG TPA: response regulator [Polyangia bacterium]|nr:response regulator [Polyangia bacterium]